MRSLLPRIEIWLEPFLSPPKKKKKKKIPGKIINFRMMVSLALSCGPSLSLWHSALVIWRQLFFGSGRVYLHFTESLKYLYMGFLPLNVSKLNELE